MSNEHTPLPWRVGKTRPINIVSENRVVAYTTSFMLHPDEVEANAALICRAVNSHDDLVAALKNIVERFDRQVGGSDLWKQARAALEKALGGQLP